MEMKLVFGETGYAATEMLINRIIREKRSIDIFQRLELLDFITKGITQEEKEFLISYLKIQNE